MLPVDIGPNHHKLVGGMFQLVFYSAVEYFGLSVTAAVVSRGKYFRNTVELTIFRHKQI
jgi:hypothetical protein